MAEASNSFVEALQGMIQAHMTDVNTCLPATIVSYKDGLARVQPSVKKRYADGDILNFPAINNVRVCWPSFAGGLAGVKGPIKAGDKCLLVFSQQAVDGSDDRRMFDLSDAYCIMSELGTATSQSTNNDDMVVYYGGASVKLSADGKVTITAPAGLDFVAPATTNSGSFTNTGALTTVGLLTYQGGMSGTGAATSNGKNIGSTHTHSGVQVGFGSTGTPN